MSPCLKTHAALRNMQVTQVNPGMRETADCPFLKLKPETED